MTQPESAQPLVPNAEATAREAMLQALGISDVDDLYASIPARLRLGRRLDLPEPLASEAELERHLRELLEADRDCTQALSFLGGGCWSHHVPAICDEISRRAEFLTAYWANSYTDHGKYQAFFEYASLLGELLDLDAVSLPTYDWGMAAAVAVRMASRITGRSEIVLAGTIGPERLATLSNYCRPDLELKHAPPDPVTGLVDLDHADALLSKGTAAIYLENPTYLGVIETQGSALATLARNHGAELIVGVDPISLGVLAPPSHYGADLICGELQPLGVQMYFGGGLSGFIASRDDQRYVREYPTFLIGLTSTETAGEYGFGLVAWDRTSYIRREKGKDFAGTTTALWAITAAVYLAMLGPRGLRELGEGLVQRACYAARELNQISGVSAPQLAGPHFKEFVVNFDASGKTVASINQTLIEQGIFGGHDLSGAFPELGQSALYSVTELHSKGDIDRLTAAVEAALETS